MDTKLAKHFMLQHQLKPLQVLDPHLLDVIQACPRELFVPEGFRSLAYADVDIPLGNDQSMLAPSLTGRILDALKLSKKDQVLEIGTGSGYLTFLLCRLSKFVTTFEIFKPLAIHANKRLADLNVANVEVICDDAFKELKGAKAFDVVVLNGSVSYLPKLILNQTKIGGRLFAIIGHPPAMQACIFTRMNEEEWSKRSLFETVVAPLKGLLDAKKFDF